MNDSKKNMNCMDDFDPDSLGMEQARELILQQIKIATQTEELPLSACLGRVLADFVSAEINVPGFKNSAMDGYAFRHSDTSTDSNLSVAGTSLAGHPFNHAIEKGQCIKVMTGALVPDSLDTVVMQENTELKNNLIVINKLPSVGDNVRNSGSNIAKGASVLAQHTRLGAVELGLLASIGCQKVKVLRKLKVACFSTGDELAGYAEEPGPGMIYDSNRPMLLGLLQHPAIEPIDLGICKDNQADLTAIMSQCEAADITISSGGVSVGDADFVKQTLSEAGTINLWKIAMKPGRPLTHAVLKSGTQFFGLPGNPVSGIVTFHQFVLPAIEAMLGQNPRAQIQQPARLTSNISKQPGRIELQRGILTQRDDGEWWVESTGLQDSHVLTSMHRANCYIVLDLESAGAKEQEWVQTLPFNNYWHPA